MRLVYPTDAFKSTKVDEAYADEYAAARDAGFAVSLFSFEAFQSGEFRPFPAIEAGDAILYRTWMVTETEYGRLNEFTTAQGGVPLTTPDSYLLCHHLPRWYPLLRQFTSETRFYSADADVAADLTAAGWDGCFLKDFVKSLSTDGGSLVKDLLSVPTVVTKMRKYRGQIEGGLCARRIEEYDPATERRFFVYHGKAYGGGVTPPPPVLEAADVISSPFFSVDVAKRADGMLRIIELGDGQVSDRKHWTSQDFIKIIAASEFA
jgi:hypothetical protein